MSRFILTIFGAVTLFCCGCDKYNYENIFPVNEETWETSVKIDGAWGYVCEVDEPEFNVMKAKFKANGFSAWQKFDIECYSNSKRINNLYYGAPGDDVIFAMKMLEAEAAVIIYFQTQKKLLLIVSEGF
ncbi:MAG: hypothetical protein MST10_00165 [Lentisphaeria bacterium]|nr:hypothetical protein [Lentisphaeria bacterium]